MTAVLLSVLLGAAPGVAVLEVDASPQLTELSAAVSTTLASELQRTGAFTVVSPEQVRVVVGYERQKQLMGCEHDCGTSALADYLDASWLLLPKLAKAGELTLTLTLIRTADSRRLETQTMRAADEKKLLAGLRALVLKTLAPLLDEVSGTIVIRASEAGAAVKLDDVTVGTTPTPGPLVAAAGVHFVSVEKDGFVAWRQELRVGPKQTALVEAALSPSPDTYAAWKSRQQTLRFGGVTAGALALVGVVTGVVMLALANDTYGSETGRGFLYERSFLLEGIEVDASGNHRLAAEQYAAQLQTQQTVAWLSFAVAGAAAVTATVLFLLTDSEDRYSGLTPKVGLALVPGGGFGALTWSFR